MEKEQSSTIGEIRIKSGQVVHFEARSSAYEQVRETLKDLRWIEPTSNQEARLIRHGSYGLQTRYQIEQHRYAACQSAYREALEIKDAPDGRGRFILHEFRADDDGHECHEFATLEELLQAHNALFAPAPKAVKDLPGFKRGFRSGEYLPWFYAVGNQRLLGDMVFPEAVIEDPVYRFLAPFSICRLDEAAPHIAHCLGFLWHEDRSGFRGERWREIFFDDGTIWRERSGAIEVRPLRDEELWKAEALRQFQRLLNGATDNFNFSLPDGRKLSAALVSSKPGANE